MTEIGKKNRLRVVRKVEFGVYLDGKQLGEILLPKRYVPKSCKLHDVVDVFIYTDSNDLLVATTETPSVMVSQCAALKVVDVSHAGAFLDWGLPKDLLLPYSEQTRPVKAGQTVCVYVFLDTVSHRIAASMKLDKYLPETSSQYRSGQEVELLICGISELGYKAVINYTHLGLLYKNEVFTPLKIGQRTRGYIKAVRPDHKLDLCLQQASQDTRDALADRILDYLRSHNGISTLTDKSLPEDIYRQYGVSKSSYKKALGGLYKRKLILIDKQHITLL